MKTSLVLAVVAALSFAGQAHSQIVINEIQSDSFNAPAPLGTDYREFIELYSLTGSITSLDGLTLVLFNGNGDVSYLALDLDGFFTDASGYFLIASTNVPGADNTSLLASGNLLQNGQDAVALYTGDFAVGGLATTTNLVDAVVYGTDDPDDTGLLAALGETVQFNEGPNPTSNAADMSLSRFPNGTGSTFVLGPQTPDAVNVPEPSSIGLLGLGAAAGLVRRRTRATS